MNRFFVYSTCVLTALSGCAHGNVTELSQNQKMLSSVPYVAEKYNDLPDETRIDITPKIYKHCLKDVDDAPYSLFTVTYLSDGIKVKGILGIPKAMIQVKPYSMVVAVRGGHADFARFNACSTYFLSDILGGNGERAFFAVQLRGAAGSPGQDEYGGNDVHDVLNAVELVKGFQEIDPRNVFLAGKSRGGMMVYLALKAGAKVAGAISIAGQSNLIRLLQSWPDMRQVFVDHIPQFKVQTIEKLRQRSAEFWAEQIHAPILVLHGDKDTKVPVEDSLELNRLLDETKTPHKLVIYPGEDHPMTSVRTEIANEITNWVQKYSSK